MKKLCSFLLGLSFVLGSAAVAVAQDKPGETATPPKILYFVREFLKPGKGGLGHEQTESAFVKALNANKSPNYYLALNSTSGKARALFISGYSSFEDWEKLGNQDLKNATLTAELDRAALVDGELLDAMDQSTWFYREDQSYNQTGSLVGVRYLELEAFEIKPGHEDEWDEAVKLVKQAYTKVPGAHWAMYQSVYGVESNTYLVITPRKSMSEVDRDFANNKQFVDAMGPDGMKKLSALSAASIQSTESNLFMISPKMSYMGADLAKDDPEFWGKP